MAQLGQIHLAVFPNKKKTFFKREKGRENHFDLVLDDESNLKSKSTLHNENLLKMYV